LQINVNGELLTKNLEIEVNTLDASGRPDNLIGSAQIQIKDFIFSNNESIACIKLSDNKNM